MNATRFEDSDVAPSEGGGYTLASCEKYWVIVEGTPGDIFLWDGAYWNDLLGSAMLYDREAAELASSLLEGSPAGVHHPVNLADYLRYDRRMAGYPRHQAGTPRHRGSFQALSDIYAQVLARSPEEQS